MIFYHSLHFLFQHFKEIVDKLAKIGRNLKVPIIRYTCEMDKWEFLQDNLEKKIFKKFHTECEEALENNLFYPLSGKITILFILLYILSS